MMRKNIEFNIKHEKAKECIKETAYTDHKDLYAPIPIPFTMSNFQVSTDSGAHTLYKKFFVQGAATQYARMNADYSWLDTAEFKKFLDDYIQHLLIHKDLYTFYVTLDIINNPQKSWEITKYIESFGLSPIPVFHNGEDISWLHKMLDEYPYFGISGLGQDITKPRFRAFGDACFSAICDSHGKPRAKVHGFAMGTPEILSLYPWYSADQSTWTYMSRVGSLLVPRPKISHGKMAGFDYLSSYKVFPVTHRRRFEGHHVNHLQGGEILKWLMAFLEQEGYTLEEAKEFYHVRDVLNIRLFYNIQCAMKALYDDKYDFAEGGNILYAGTPAGASSNIGRLCRLLYDIKIPKMHWLGTPVYNKHLENCLAYKKSALAGEDFRVHWDEQKIFSKKRPPVLTDQKPKLARKSITLPKPETSHFDVVYDVEITFTKDVKFPLTIKLPASGKDQGEALKQLTDNLKENLSITVRFNSIAAKTKPVIRKREIKKVTPHSTSFNNFL